MSTPRYGWVGFYCGYEGEYIQRHLEESGLNQAMKGEESKRGRGKERGQADQERSRGPSSPRERKPRGQESTGPARLYQKLEKGKWNSAPGLENFRVGGEWEVLEGATGTEWGLSRVSLGPDTNHSWKDYCWIEGPLHDVDPTLDIAKIGQGPEAK